MIQLQSDEDKKIARQGLGDCSICFEHMFVGDKTDDSRISAFCPCGHILHTRCYTQWHQDGKNTTCPNCRKQVSVAIMLARDAPLFDALQQNEQRRAAGPTGRDEQEHHQRLQQQQQQPHPTPAQLVQRRIDELQTKIVRANSGQKEIAKLEAEIRDLDQARENLNYLRYKYKMSSGIAIVHRHDPLALSTALSSKGKEMKFLYAMEASTAAKKKELLEKLAENTKELEKIVMHTQEAEQNRLMLESEVAYLRHELAQRGLAMTSGAGARNSSKAIARTGVKNKNSSGGSNGNSMNKDSKNAASTKNRVRQRDGDAVAVRDCEKRQKPKNSAANQLMAEYLASESSRTDRTAPIK